ncbi:MAG: tetratricopeptide repeat protein [Bacteroidales bacterium]|nr:tetratricopeptide repeat protein [Bacteroidales bacterium]
MKTRTIIIYALAAAISANATARTLDDRDAVLRLYEAGMYSEARSELSDKPADAFTKGYDALCALKLRLPEAYDVAEAYVAAWPESTLVPQVYFAWAANLFDEGRYDEAYSRYDLIRPRNLYSTQGAEYHYKKAYCEFTRGDFVHARTLFERSESEPYSTYTAPAQYSLGFIAYSEKRFGDALEWFGKSVRDARFEAISNYYILECRFMLKDYAYVVKDGEAMYESIPEDRKPHLARIISESYLVLGNADKAKKYYDLGSRSSMTRADYFYAGSLMYAIGDYAGAIDNYSRMTARTDSLGQIANYQMGYSYIQTKNKVAALTAFRDASNATYDDTIREDAYFNYAKLAFDLNHDTSAFNDYLKKYDYLKKGDRIYGYIALANLYNHDYEGAVAAYDKIEELDAAMKSNYMKAYYLRGHQLIGQGSYRKAVPALKTAAYYSPRRDPFNQMARYWMAESLYRDEAYDEARTTFTELYNLSALDGREESRLLPYNIAYCYFRQGDYANANKWFEKYINTPGSTLSADAGDRIGDGYFYTKDYKNAINAYEARIAANPSSPDLYPHYQAGIAKGLLNDRKGKVTTLETVLNASPSTPLYAETMYELGRAYIDAGRNDDAVNTFRTLRSNTSDATIAARSLIELGTIARNAGSHDEALSDYKQVVTAMPGSEYAESALLAIESIYRTKGEPAEYLAYVDSLGGAGRTDSEKESMYFNTAEQIYFNENYQKALLTFLNYQSQYPDGAHTAQSCYYIAECYRMLDNKEQARDYYNRAVDEGEGSYVELSMLHFANLSYALGHYNDAYRAYNSLLNSAQLDNNRLAAVQGMIRAAYKDHAYDDAIAASDRLTKDFKVNADAAREASYLKAKSYLESSRRDEAYAIFRTLAKSPSTSEGAEAAYLVIQDMYDQGNFDGIEDKVYSFAQSAGSQRYWLAKAFIVLGDSFMEDDNVAQARATFESIRDGYKPAEGTTDDVLDQIAMRLSKIKNLQ